MLTITWYGTAALKLQADDTALVFDPYMGFPEKNLKLRNIFRETRAILVTHGHFDHIEDIPKLFLDSGVKVYATETPEWNLLRGGIQEQQMVTVRPGSEFTVDPLRIRVYQARHARPGILSALRILFRKRTYKNFSDLMKLLKTHRALKENGETVLYDMVTGDDLRIQVMGSLGVLDHVHYPTGADVLVLPYQGSDRLVRDALHVIDVLRPKRIILDHFDDAFPPLTENVDTRDIVRQISNRYGIDCTVPEKGRPIVITKAVG